MRKACGIADALDAPGRLVRSGCTDARKYKRAAGALRAAIRRAHPGTPCGKPLKWARCVRGWAREARQYT